MRATSPSAFVSSLTLHAGVVLAACVLLWYVRAHTPKAPVIFELVAGPPDGQQHLTAGGADAAPQVDYKARQPLDLPTPPAPVEEATPPPPTPVPPPPAAKTPATATAKPPPAATVPNLTRAVKRSEAKVVAKEKKKEEAEEKARQEQERKTSIEKFRQQQAAGKTAVPRIDGKAMADALRSAAVRTGAGEGGKALSHEEQNELDFYTSQLLQALRNAHNNPPGLSDLRSARVEFTIAADGTLSQARIVQSSGNAEFDRSVLEAFAAMHGGIGPTPKGESGVWAITFKPSEDQ